MFNLVSQHVVFTLFSQIDFTTPGPCHSSLTSTVGPFVEIAGCAVGFRDDRIWLQSVRQDDIRIPTINMPQRIVMRVERTDLHGSDIQMVNDWAFLPMWNIPQSSQTSNNLVTNLKSTNVHPLTP
jgi:hypothetical protein